MRSRPGLPIPLGAHWDGLGTNFAIYSRHATSVELCLFAGPGDAEPMATCALEARTGHVWHAYLPNLGPGQLYGYRLDGPWDPSAGHRFNPAKLVQDPYARAICGDVTWAPALRGDAAGAKPSMPDPRDSASAVPRSVVVDESFPWGDDAPPRTHLSRSVVYECHVKGMTQRHPELPPGLRGTYRGLASEPIVAHLKELGVTAVELLPVHHRVSEQPLGERGLSNYWGYNTLGYFAPDARFATGDRGEQVSEFKAMVKGLHQAGLEVILDVVYNHTAEGGAHGPTLCFRGVDNASYYQLDPDDPRQYIDTSGCGNGLSMQAPPGLWLLMDSLRYWVAEMHVDGFRFDLAPSLARGAGGRLNGLTGIFDVIRQDPVLAQTKLIAEPWDLGPDGFQLGGFPESYAEWNAHYRDGVRRFWRGDRGMLGDLASRLSGSSQLFGGRSGPLASLNFVTAHDGFTLADLVSYEQKHNDSNGEDSRDGTDANWSRNWGAEGPTPSESIQELRDRVARNLVATLAFSQGVPMLSHGDEFLRSQGGNNNAYCQDDETSWLDWTPDTRQREFLAFVRQVFALRARYPSLRRTRFLRGGQLGDSERDVVWLKPGGGEMTETDWSKRGAVAVAMWLRSEEAIVRHARNRAAASEALLIAVNGGERARRFVLPALPMGESWHPLISTGAILPERLRGESFRAAPQSLVLLAARAVR